MKDTDSVWGTPKAVHFYEKVQGTGSPQKGPPQGKNYSRNYGAYRSPTKWTVMIDKKGDVMRASVHATRQRLYYVQKYGHEVYIRD